MTSSNRTIFRVTCPLWGELWCFFFLSMPEQIVERAIWRLRTCQNSWIHMYTKFNYDTFVRFSVITKNVHVSFIKEQRGATLRSPCDVMDDVITTKNTFSCIIWDDLFISDIKLKLHVIFWHFQNGRHFDVTGNFFLPEVIAEVNHNRKMTHNQRCISVFVSVL